MIYYFCNVVRIFETKFISKIGLFFLYLLMRSWYWVGSSRVGGCGQRRQGEGRILSSLMQRCWSTFDACQTWWVFKTDCHGVLLRDIWSPSQCRASLTVQLFWQGWMYLHSCWSSTPSSAPGQLVIPLDNFMLLDSVYSPRWSHWKKT